MTCVAWCGIGHQELNKYKWKPSSLSVPGSHLEVLKAGCQCLVQGQIFRVDLHIVVTRDGEHLVHNVVLLLQGRQLCGHASQERQVLHKLFHSGRELVQALWGTLVKEGWKCLILWSVCCEASWRKKDENVSYYDQFAVRHHDERMKMSHIMISLLWGIMTKEGWKCLILWSVCCEASWRKDENVSYYDQFAVRHHDKRRMKMSHIMISLLWGIMTKGWKCLILWSVCCEASWRKDENVSYYDQFAVRHHDERGMKMSHIMISLLWGIMTKEGWKCLILWSVCCEASWRKRDENVSYYDQFAARHHDERGMKMSHIMNSLLWGIMTKEGWKCLILWTVCCEASWRKRDENVSYYDQFVVRHHDERGMKMSHIMNSLLWGTLVKEGWKCLILWTVCCEAPWWRRDENVSYYEQFAVRHYDERGMKMSHIMISLLWGIMTKEGWKCLILWTVCWEALWWKRDENVSYYEQFAERHYDERGMKMSHIMNSLLRGIMTKEGWKCLILWTVCWEASWRKRDENVSYYEQFVVRHHDERGMKMSHIMNSLLWGIMTKEGWKCLILWTVCWEASWRKRDENVSYYERFAERHYDERGMKMSHIMNGLLRGIMTKEGWKCLILWTVCWEAPWWRKYEMSHIMITLLWGTMMNEGWECLVLWSVYCEAPWWMRDEHVLYYNQIAVRHPGEGGMKYLILWSDCCEAPWWRRNENVLYNKQSSLLLYYPFLTLGAQCHKSW